MNMFGEIVKQLKLPSTNLVLDCCTRWNATFFILSAALKFKEVFPRFAQRNPNYLFLPSEEDWIKVDEVCSFLEEFNEAINVISGAISLPTFLTFIDFTCFPTFLTFIDF